MKIFKIRPALLAGSLFRKSTLKKLSFTFQPKGKRCKCKFNLQVLAELKETQGCTQHFSSLRMKRKLFCSQLSLYGHKKKLCSYSKAKKEKHFCLVRKSINTEVSNHCTLALHISNKIRTFICKYLEVIVRFFFGI